MKIHLNGIKITQTIFSLGLLLFLYACQRTESPTQPDLPSPDPAQETIAALLSENLQLSTQVSDLAASLQTERAPTATQAVTETPEPSLTPTPGPTLSVPTGYITATHTAAPGYVFVYDPDFWQVANAQDVTADFLVYEELEDCRVNLAPESAPGDLLRYYPRIVGRLGWLVEGYEETDYFLHQDLRLALPLSEDEDCPAARDEILGDLMSLAEFNGAPASTPAAQPTQRPALEGFTCAEAPAPRLRVGDRAVIVTGFLWLREAPRVEEATEVLIYPQYAPVDIRITGGPICEGNSVFWEATVRELAEGGETLTGWMAENGGQEVFLDVWYAGW